MKMQDNEFDDLFRSKLENFETEPSNNVWENINHELNNGRRKRVLIPILSIAASILVLIVAGILFVPKKENSVIKNHPQNKTAKVASVNDNQSVTATVAVIAKPAKDAKKAENSSLGTFSVAKATKYVARESQGGSVDTANSRDAGSPVLAAIGPVKDQITTKGVVPDENTQIAIPQPVFETVSPVNTPAIATTTPQTNTQSAVPPSSKRSKIQTLGDIINVVVAKVDKRKDKILEFSDSDDESNLIGVNLGIIKLKKDQ